MLHTKQGFLTKLSLYSLRDQKPLLTLTTRRKVWLYGHSNHGYYARMAGYYARIAIPFSYMHAEWLKSGDIARAKLADGD